MQGELKATESPALCSGFRRNDLPLVHHMEDHEGFFKIPLTRSESLCYRTYLPSEAPLRQSNYQSRMGASAPVIKLHEWTSRAPQSYTG
ncbi:hypothetical protein N7510_011562 [Penicillium lagena]|uniref:uncharacterized protein n=1 Tax=Penicillium lagena TaxID=94218 RepID=UPI002540EDC4|nr:uncharacterized protein N7510_011562 [Penicillium lagena]KAJ5602028.1 hypothetical protein N7510_011562 [Penicillium lagena]